MKHLIKLAFVLLTIISLASCGDNGKPKVQFRATTLENNTILKVYEVLDYGDAQTYFKGDTVWVDNTGIINNSDSTAMKCVLDEQLTQL